MSFMKYITKTRYTILDLFSLLLAIVIADVLGTNDLYKMMIAIGVSVPASLLSVLLERHYHEKD